MRGREKSRWSYQRAAWRTRKTSRRIQPSRLCFERVEERLVLSTTGLEGNPYAPDLDLSAVGTQSAAVGEQFSIDLYASGALATDLDEDGNASGDTIRLQLDPDDNPTGATLTSDGILTWTPTEGQLGVQEFIILAVDEGSPPLADAEVLVIEVFEGNNAPDLADISDVEATVGETVTVTISATDEDDGDTLTFAFDPDASIPDAATLTDQGDNTAVISWTPAEGETGDFVFSVLVIDDGSPAMSDSESFTITVSEAEDPNETPVAVADSYSVETDGELTTTAATGVLQNDTDADGDSLTAVLVSTVENGTLNWSTDGSFTYTPDSSFEGTDSFVYKANDGEADSNQVTVTLSVVGETHAPVAADDEYETVEDTVLTVSADDGVLANDTDEDGDTLSVEIVAEPEHGTIVLNSSGSFSYSPDSGYSGSDSFTYTASDGEDSSETATVTIVVEENVAPTGTADEYSVISGATLEVVADSGVLANDTDDNGQSLTASITSAPLYGTLTLQSDGSFVYTSSSSYSGTDSFQYVAYDGSLSSEDVTVTITVRENNAPVAEADSYSVSEDGTLEVDADSGVLANDSDADGDALTLSLLTGPFHGTVTLDSDGSFVYTPNDDYSGSDLFTYEISDGLLDSGSTTVSLTVVAVNDAPEAEDDAYDVEENTALTVDATSGVLANDTDVDEDSLTVSLVSGPSYGTLSLDSDGSFTYTPNTDYTGEDSFVYEVTDSEETTQAEVTLQVGTTTTTGGLVITEINYNPVEPTESELAVDSDFTDNDFEYVELANTGDTAIDLTGLLFISGVTFDFSESSITTLGAGEVILLVSNQEAFEARYGTDLPVAGEFDGKLSNGGEDLVIVDATDAVIASCTYDDEGDWPTEADGDGYTLERISLDDADDPDNWSIGDEGGSPGTVPDWDTLVATVLADETT